MAEHQDTKHTSFHKVEVVAPAQPSSFVMEWRQHMSAPGGWERVARSLRLLLQPGTGGGRGATSDRSGACPATRCQWGHRCH